MQDAIEVTEEPELTEEEREEQERQRSIFGTLEALLTNALDMAIHAGGTPATVDGAISGALAIHIQKHIREGRERPWLEETIVQDTLDWIELDRAQRKPMN